MTAIGVALPPPAADLCWYWTNPAKNKGYCDYCFCDRDGRGGSVASACAQSLLVLAIAEFERA